MKDTLFVIGMLLHHLLDYPLAVVQDFLWFKLNHRPKWLRKSRDKYFDRLAKDRIRLEHITTRVRFYVKRTRDAQS
jgi:hypothetical protein